MKGLLLPGLLFVLITLVNVIVPADGKSGGFPVPVRDRAVDVGIYDPHDQFAAAPDVAIDHAFVDWNMPPARTKAALRSAQRRNRSLMVTLEPFPRPGEDLKTYISNLLSGDYDGVLAAHCDVLSQASGRVFLRFAHEMDLDNGRYAWSGMPGDFYASVYRHAIGVCRAAARNIITVWSPVGNPSLEKYYPGQDVVDVVGLSLFGLQPWEEIAYGRSRRFAESFAEKYSRVAAFGKPVTIAEFGVCGTPLYRVQWLADAFGEGARLFPLLKSVVYFNDREPYRWPDAGGPPRTVAGCDVEFPDWRLRR